MPHETIPVTVDKSHLITIGSPHKLQPSRSPAFHPPRIAQFGIGKLATLSACKRFQVLTRKGVFAARITFDKEAWESTGDVWQLPMEVLPPDAREGNGTTVVPSGMNRQFKPKDIEAKIVEGTPLKAPHFDVRLRTGTAWTGTHSFSPGF